MPQVLIKYITTMLRFAEVTKRTGLSKTTIDRFEKAGKFPKRRKIGARAVGWSEEEVRQWIAEQPFKITLTDVTEREPMSEPSK